jgi:hypothetical protein
MIYPVLLIIDSFCIRLVSTLYSGRITTISTANYSKITQGKRLDY